MFTGIIEELGLLRGLIRNGTDYILNIEASKILNDIALGDSIAVNGVCLTVTSFTKNNFTVDVMEETLKATNIGFLDLGSSVNLERAMAANGRFGGHMVSGHVDGMGLIKDKRVNKNAIYVDISCDKSITDTLLYRGSVAVDGTSLTIFGLEDGLFTLSLIPHTQGLSVLGTKPIGSKVNIESDLIGKYVKKFIIQKQDSEASPKGMSEDWLKEQGF